MFPLPLKEGAGFIDVATNLYSSPVSVMLFSAINRGGEESDSWRTPSENVSTPRRTFTFVTLKISGFQRRITSMPYKFCTLERLTVTLKGLPRCAETFGGFTSTVVV